MQVFRFREEGTDRVAFCADGLGYSLPKQGRVWHYIGKCHLEVDQILHVGESPREIASAVRAHGIFVWPPYATTSGAAMT